MQESNLIEVLNAVEQKDFLNPTFIASGHETVADILADSSEVKFLLNHREAALDVMHKRLREGDKTMADNVRLVYFVVFGVARDRNILGDILAYLRRSRTLSPSTLLSPWHPFLHGLKALERITGSAVKAPGSGAGKKQFDRFLNEVEKWGAAHPDG